MLDLVLIGLSIAIVTRYRKANEPGAWKYVVGIWAAVLGAMLLGGVIAGAGGSQGGVMFLLFIGYGIAIAAAVAGMRSGKKYQENYVYYQRAKQNGGAAAARAEIAAAAAKAQMSSPQKTFSAASAPPAAQVQSLDSAIATLMNHYASNVAGDENGWKQDVLASVNTILDDSRVEAASKITSALLTCARGLGSSAGFENWYHGGKYLVRLLAEIGTPSALEDLYTLASTDSQSAEWDTIRGEAVIALGNTGDGKWLPKLTALLDAPHAPVRALNQAITKLSPPVRSEPTAFSDLERANPRMILSAMEGVWDAEAEIEKALTVLDDVPNWPTSNQSYYYFLLAVKCQEGFKNDAHKAFYAMQLFIDPSPSCVGWNRLGESPSPENAKKLHEMYPLPNTLEQIRNYQVN